MGASKGVLMWAVKRGDRLLPWTIRDCDGSIAGKMEMERLKQVWGLIAPEYSLVMVSVEEVGR